ncbi:MAG: serine/threonine-protein phosphatase [Pirellulaceae bacterium]|nr:serine/threonine-protein phosphatase [Pirellulaceae bacterium]MCU0981666.1 serine/threonine-protein phosphatase [Pirellulaceae bacterium]
MTHRSDAMIEGWSLGDLPHPERMQCMEVWGGNRETNKSFEMPGLQTWIFSRPHQRAESGGDVYYLSSCASGRITRFLLADVMGHGTSAADTARGLRDLMRQNINLIQQASLVRSMNQRFSDVAQQGGFATALVGTFFSPRRSLAICNAGHPFPLVYRAAKSDWSVVQRPASDSDTVVDLPLGIMKEADYLTTEVRLDTGDLVLGFSDALTESCNRDGQLLGGEGIRKLVQELDASRPDDLISQLLEKIIRESPQNLVHDDLTVVLLRVTGTRSRIKDNLLAPFRLFGGVADRTEWA